MSIRCARRRTCPVFSRPPPRDMPIVRIPPGGHVQCRPWTGAPRSRGTCPDGGTARRACAFAHSAAGPCSDRQCRGVTMSAWSISTKCFQPTTASRAPNTSLPRASRTSSSSRRWPAAQSPAWHAAFTQCPDADARLIAIRSLPAEPACVTAAQFRGLWVLEPPPQPHIAVPHSRHYPGFVCHRSAAPPTLLDTVVQSLRCLPELDGLVIAESAVVVKGVTARRTAAAAGRPQRREGAPNGEQHRPPIAVHHRVHGPVLAAEGRVPCGVPGQHPRNGPP